jgi:light-regulated signal transduction histidine kinase (bacteriophytochrome)
VVDAVKRLTGFERVMLYRFAETVQTPRG